jgi:hypothetical protein
VSKSVNRYACPRPTTTPPLPPPPPPLFASSGESRIEDTGARRKDCTALATMRLDLSGLLLESLGGKRQYFCDERSR